MISVYAVEVEILEYFLESLFVELVVLEEKIFKQFNNTHSD
jgi:hypothetical protein